MDYLRLPIGKDAPATVNAIVEIPRGETNKYEYDPELGVFRLSRPLFVSALYPGDYGFVPSTLTKDGDPLDVLILVDRPSFPGCLIEARPIGALDMIDRGQKDVKILCVCAQSPSFAPVTDFRKLAPHVLREIEHFFQIYKQLEKVQPQIRGWRNAAAARKWVRDAHARFQSKKPAGGG